jgi:hypothetical protein
VTTGVLVVFATLPIWLPSFLREAPGGALLLAAGTIAVGTGFVLAWESSADHVVSTSVGIRSAASLATFIFGVGAMWWASRIIGLDLVVLLFALTLLADAANSPSTWSDNPWKFAFSFPVSLIVLTLAARMRSTLVVLGALAALGLCCVLHDSRERVRDVRRSSAWRCSTSGCAATSRGARRAPCSSRRRSPSRPRSTTR